MKKAVLVFAAVCIIAVHAAAQTTQEDVSQAKIAAAETVCANAPHIISARDKKPATLQDIKIGIEVTGNFVVTTYDMVFYNPNQSVMEGEFVMPLTENGNVLGAESEINGKMRKGVIVEKKKVRQEFEPAAGTEITPVKDEKIYGKCFRMKAYPFAPENTRRIRVSVEEPLQIKNGGYFYLLPLNFEGPVKLDLSVEIPSEIVEGMPIVETNLPDLEFKKGNNVLKASFSGMVYRVNENFSVVLPRQKEEPVFTHKEGKATYFYSDINVSTFPAKNKVFPSTVAIVWDCSLSAQKRDVKKELALLDAYFKKVSNTEVLLTFFNIQKSPLKSYSVKNGGWDSLKKDLARTVYDGATDFNKLNLNELKADEILLFTDGFGTLGNSRLAAGTAPVYAINSCVEFDRGALESASIKSGGFFIDLNSVAEKDAVELLTKQNLKLVSYSYNKEKIKEVYPMSGTPVSEHFSFSGVLTAPEAEITLSFGYGKNDIAFVKKIKIRSSGDNPSVERLWALKKIKQLEMNCDKNEKEIVKLGQKYSVITEFTSLLVLETAADYAMYKVSPPKELIDEYNKIMSASKKEEKDKKTAALEDAVLQVQDIKDWWKHDYALSKQVKTAGQLKNETAFGMKRDEVFANVPAATAGEVKASSASPEAQYASAKSKNVSPSAGSAAPETKKEDKIKKQGYSAAQIKARDPETPYMKIIVNSLDEEMYADYLKLKAGYGDQPSFYFDIADEFIRRKMKDEAVVVLSNIAEMRQDCPELLRVTAYKLMEAKSYSYAVNVFEKLVKIRAEDPQSHRDLALAYQANKEYKKALNAFYKILTRDWDRFQSIKQVAFVEMNNMLSLYPDINTSEIDKRLIFPMPVDIRVVLGWSADDTDIDIYVKEPGGETASYENRFTRSGGRVSEDLTQGFGPEEYMIKKASNGDYEISTDYYGDEKQSISGPTVLYLDIYTFYGTKKQTHKRVIVRTENVKQNDIIGAVNFRNK